MIKNQSGIVTVDFIFSIIISFSMILIVFAVTLTLSVVEVTQYAVFSAARAQSAGNLDPEAQIKAARDKYNSLTNDPLLKGVFKGAFFTVTEGSALDIRAGESVNGNFDEDYPSKDEKNREVFQGVRTVLTSKILQLKIPFLGSVTNDEEGFKSKVVAIILREPAMSECLEFMKQRMDQLWQIDGGRSASFKGAGKKMPVAWEDNGC